MYTYKHGGKNGSTHHLDVADDLIVVRTKDNKELEAAIKSKPGKTILSQLTTIAKFPEAGVTVLQGKHSQNRLVQLRDQARAQLKKEKDIRFAGRVLRDSGSGAPVVYTENFFVKFKDGLGKAACEKILKKHNLKIKRRLKYAKNACFVSAPEGTGLEIFRIAQDLLDEKDVELCHPELIRKASRRAIAPQQWHLQQTVVNGKTVNAHVNVEGAWEVTRGAGVVIAIVDEGIDIDHEEFAGTGKIVSPRDVERVLRATERLMS